MVCNIQVSALTAKVSELERRVASSNIQENLDISAQLQRDFSCQCDTKTTYSFIYKGEDLI